MMLPLRRPQKQASWLRQSSPAIMMQHSADAIAAEINTKSCLKSSSPDSCTPRKGRMTRTNSIPELPKTVNFDSIEIREHSVELGDHPDVTDGLPITLGWKVHRRSSFNLDEYELTKVQNGVQTRGEGGGRKKPNRISADQRASLLLSNGHSLDEFVDTTLEIRKIKQARIKSVRDRDWGEMAKPLKELLMRRRIPQFNFRNVVDPNSKVGKAA